MFKSTRTTLVTLGLIGAMLIVSGGPALAQGQAQASLKKAPASQPIEVNGAVVKRDGETFVVRTLDRSEYEVLLTDSTVIKTERKGLLRPGKELDVTSIMVGLILGVNGTGDANGRVVADKVHFTEKDLKAAITSSINTQIVEAKVVAANQRITDLDQWVDKGTVSVYFDTNSFEISAEGKKSLDELAAKAPGASNYQVEITGHTDTTGTDTVNDELSEKRAEAVVNYLTVKKGIPLRRIVLPQGYGATLGTFDNSTPEGRAKNRRVDVKVQVNKGLTETQAPAAPVTTPTTK